MANLRLVTEHAENTEVQPLQPTGQPWVVTSDGLLNLYIATRDDSVPVEQKAKARWDIKDPLLTHVINVVSQQSDHSVSSTLRAGILTATVSMMFVANRFNTDEASKIKDVLDLGDKEFTIEIMDHVGLVHCAGAPIGFIFSPYLAATGTAGLTGNDRDLIRRFDLGHPNTTLENTEFPFIMKIKEKPVIDMKSQQEAIVAELKQLFQDMLKSRGY